MIFINAIIRATDDLEFRMQLRNEFYTLEFGYIFEVRLSSCSHNPGALFDSISQPE